MGISIKTRKNLWGKSGNRCAYCKTELVLEKDQFNRILNIGEECHIISQQVNGPRFKEIVKFDYDDIDNLILLCCNHHKMIDEQIEMFSVEKLHSLKNEHEIWVTNNLKTEETNDLKNQKTRIDALMSYIITKHDIDMNIRTAKQIFNSEEGLKIAFDEIKAIKKHVYEVIDKIKIEAPNYNVVVRDNNQHICDLMFKGKTLLIQFYQAYSNSPDDSYLLFAIVDGYFDKNGYADPLFPAKMKVIIRLNFSYNENGFFGWRNQENHNEFFISKDITEIWIEKYFTYTLS